MSKLIIDDALGHQLGQFTVPVEVCDHAGKTLGHFVPTGTPWMDVLSADRCPYPADEFHRMQQETGGRPLGDIWKSLGNP